jgi:hypothetical protein
VGICLLVKVGTGWFTKHLIIGALDMTLGLKEEEAEQCSPRTQEPLADSIVDENGDPIRQTSSISDQRQSWTGESAKGYSTTIQQGI